MLGLMSKIYLVSDSKAVLDEVTSALEFVTPDIASFANSDALVAACQKKTPDLVVLDMQIGNMGGMAICMHLHLEESGGRLPHIPVLMLIDRRADVFLARRSRSEGFLVKPLNSIRIANAAKTILSGKPFEDDSYRPVTVEFAT